MQVSMMRKQGNWDQAKQLRQLVQSMPSKDSCDPNYRRLWYVRYADDILVGFAGPKNEAEQIKNEIAKFLNEELKLMLNEDKTLITHACDSKANFLGYEIHVLHADDKHDHRTQRWVVLDHII
ncbi:reverse transcriptase domain-containing protein [Wolbachia endosymbiont of Cylisticus convexus]|nr:reverse transcriptase domain-containing protein [Wolbachia endosymbiont of Cylisticus convexus]